MERAAPQDDLGAAVRHRVECRETLENANGIVRAQHRHCGAQTNAPRATRDRRQQHLGSGDREIGAVMLADADEIYPKFVREHGLLEDVAQHPRMRK